MQFQSHEDPHKNHPSVLKKNQWRRVEDLFYDAPPGFFGGRPRIESRRCFEAAWWKRSHQGARWKDLPSDYPSATTVHRRLREWEASGVWQLAKSRLSRIRNER